MSQRAVTLSVTMPSSALADRGGDAVARFLTASATSWFCPTGACGGAGSTTWQVGDARRAPVWRGEERRPGDPMSSLAGALPAELIAAIAARFAADPPDAELSVWGGLRARQRLDDPPSWLARWWPDDNDGHELVSLVVRAIGPHVLLAITWGLWGFPLTAVGLATPRTSYRHLDAARRARADLLPAVATAIAAMGVAADACGWGFEVELASDHRWLGGVDVADELTGRWLPALRRGLAHAVVEPVVEDSAAASAARLRGDLATCAQELTALLRTPNPDPRVVAAVAERTADRRPALLQIPFRFGPIGLLAELVAARMRARRGEDPRAYVWSTPPLTVTEIEQRERERALPPLVSSWSAAAPHAPTLARYQRLCDLGVLDEQGYALDGRHNISDLAPPEDPIDAVVPVTPAAAPSPDEAQLVADLDAGGDRRAWALEDLVTAPLSSPAVSAAIARALDDRTPCGLAGALVGEIRLLAAAALAAARFRSADLTPVEVAYTVPLSSGELLAARAAHPDAPSADDYDERLRLFVWLRDHVGLPEVRGSLRHPVDLLSLAPPP